ncbi:hypothetical protein [Bradyrhizobium quebecense]|uniref:Novel STAND NTPase 3 domain-containing protein n=2 Tax=Bradyrhizobium quebecense TaxID=2748629 RepID=A0ABS3MWK9_9BRAD|nr:hypothetical protein [Bradyrhizobium quebecense]UGY07437.1 hypothetical protein J4P68_0040395 [Bradyrhizobium quebecense]
MTSTSAPTVVATPTTYELHSLGWKAFQQLCVSVAAEVWGQTVQGFFESHDGGRDGAFYGSWTSNNGETFTGNFTAQCKFSQKPGRNLALSSLKDELEKAARLAARGLADNYFLFTNMQLTGTADEAIRGAFEALPGLNHCRIFGADQISQFIRESARLRMLIPRVYGLGDLGQILDHRAYDQAQEILSALGDDMNKFVMTDAFRASARAIVEHGFVLLLGEPACGKSAIAAALALGALDEWNCFTVKVREPSEFVATSNPREKQFFWVDDAFGATQLDWQMTSEWNATFPHVRAAIRRGAKFVFTSRDYIYKNARSFLKESALPVIQDSQVIIRVEQLSKDEREQILYNHIRLGSQPFAFKRRLKPYLDAVAVHRRFSPEIARRLGNPAFTKHLSVTTAGLDDFVEHPVPLLQEVIRTLDPASRAAIALVFMRGGWLSSPVTLLAEEENAVALLGASSASVRAALAPLDGSLLIEVKQKGQYGWRAKHPTVLDAFAALVVESRELMDIYLAGAPVLQLFSEITCGADGIGGVKVEVPADRYEGLVKRIITYHDGRRENRNPVISFLANRCGKDFLRLFLERCPGFVEQLHVMSYFYAVPPIDFLNVIHEFGLLDEELRLKHAATIRKLATSTPDSGCLNPRIVSFLTGEEKEQILADFRDNLLPVIDIEIDNWKDNYSSDESPGDYFEPFRSALNEFKAALVDDADAVFCIEAALLSIDAAISILDGRGREEPDYGDYYNRSSEPVESNSSRSIFDDVDT